MIALLGDPYSEYLTPNRFRQALLRPSPVERDYLAAQSIGELVAGPCALEDLSLTLPVNMLLSLTVSVKILFRWLTWLETKHRKCVFLTRWRAHSTSQNTIKWCAILSACLYLALFRTDASRVLGQARSS